VEFVMRYLFWIVLLVIVALAGGFWFLTVPAQREESKKLQTDISRLAAELKGYAAKKDKIKTQAHVDAANEYKAKLAEEEKAVKTMFLGKKTTLDPKFEQAPKDPLAFDEWLQKNGRKEILDLAAKTKMVLPANFAQEWLDEGRITTKAGREARLRKIALAGEVVRLLCSVKANVPVTEFSPKMEEKEVTKLVQAGVTSLDGMILLDPAKRDDRVKDYVTHAFASSAKAPPALKKLPGNPCRTSLLDVRFTAPLQVVPGVVQAFETSPRWFGIVTKVDCQRAAEPYSKTPLPASADTVKVGTDGKTTFYNTHYKEAPVQVQIWVELYDFDDKQLQ
jgi:hypothetical protein